MSGRAASSRWGAAVGFVSAASLTAALFLLFWLKNAALDVTPPPPLPPLAPFPFT